MANPKLTNILLGIIALLLLVLVIQNPSNHASDRTFDFHDGMGREPIHGGGMPSSMGMGHSRSMDSKEIQHAHSAQMVIGALSCPADASLTLAEPGCTGKDANNRRKMVEEALAQNLSISKIFDLMVQKFGEDALLESALRIWKNRQAGNQ